MQEVAHNTIMEVNLTALKYNVDYFRSKLYPTTRLVCMVKADAYGMGATQIAHSLEKWGCNYFAVAFANEGVDLRTSGIHLPIIVLDPNVKAVEQMVKHQLEPEVFSFDYLSQLTKELQRLGASNYPIHIKIDSGMHRAGFQKQEIKKLIKVLQQTPEVKVISLFSHLVGADDSKFDSFTKQQINYFNLCAEELSEALPYPIFRHILNSAGIERFPDYQMDMVRLGIGLWGISANGTKLKNVVSLRSLISQLRWVPQEETIGYSRKGIISRDSLIALVPIGYADGINRRLGNGNIQVEINGIMCPSVGNICMDLMMVDVTDVPNVKVGDTVTIFGDLHPANKIAETLETIPYEIYTSIAPRVKRIYVEK